MFIESLDAREIFFGDGVRGEAAGGHALLQLGNGNFIEFERSSRALCFKLRGGLTQCRTRSQYHRRGSQEARLDKFSARGTLGTGQVVAFTLIRLRSLAQLRFAVYV